jgi:hypothetical protein
MDLRLGVGEGILIRMGTVARWTVVCGTSLTLRRHSSSERVGIRTGILAMLHRLTCLIPLNHPICLAL